MSTLYGLVGSYKELYEAMLEDDPESKEVWEDTLEGVIGEIEVKGGDYVSVINQLQMEEDACDKQIKEWEYRKKVRENAVKRLKERLMVAMVQLDKDEIKAGDYTIKRVNNGGKIPLKYFSDSLSDIPQNEVDLTTVPNEYKKTIISESLDTDKIREALDEGKKLDFVEYGTRGQHIRIK